MTGTVYDSYTPGTGTENSLYRVLNDTISDARRRLWITVPWWDTSEPARPLLDAAIAAKSRGVDVRVIARPTRNNDAVLARLRDAGAEVITIENLHDKRVISDDRALTLSSNFIRKELLVNENSGKLDTDSASVAIYEAMFNQLVSNRDALAVGQEKWTRAAEIIPSRLTRYLERYEKLNPLQSMAVPAVLSAAGHTMVVAPTSSGKTLVGEVAALRSIILEGRPAVWLVPARALAAEVAQTAARWRRLGVDSLELTGEVNLSSEKARKAQLWIATTEKFESMYRRSTLTDFIDRIGCLVIDEVHLVGDPSRGPTLEAVIARLRLAEGRTRIVALSATVANAEELAEWFDAQLIESPWRPTVLTTEVVPYRPGSGRTDFQKDEAGKDIAITELFCSLATTDPDRPATLRGALDQKEGALGSVLTFCGSKPAVRRTASMFAGIQAAPGDDVELVRRARQQGVGIHFRDAPGASDALKAFNDREISTLVATSGLSTGVNTPARIVIIRDLTLGISDLEVSQAQQMLGRAGRAGQEREGFGFLLAPEKQVMEWRQKLAEGYRVDSKLIGQIDDAVLAEILLGAITSRLDADIWFKGTFAFAQSTEMHDVGAVIDALVKHRLVSEAGDELKVTELGKVTARLMIGVEAACNMLDGLSGLGYPLDADSAENRVLGLVADSVPVLRGLPVNERTYEDWVTTTFAACGEGLDEYAGTAFGSKFAAAAGAAALRDPGRFAVPRGSKMARGELIRAVAELPRFLGWLSALGELGESAWAPAVAGDLSRRLQWWTLDPRPERGSGRLLWFLEQLLDSEHRSRRMPDLWRRARSNGFDNPNSVTAPPRKVDVTGEAFAELASRRAHLVLSPPEGTSLPLEAGPYGAELAVVTNCGSVPVYSAMKALGERIELPVPHGSDRDELAADVILYTRSDFAYQNLTTDIPRQVGGHTETTLRRVRPLIAGLNPAAAVAPHHSRVRRLFMGERKKTLAEIMPQVAPEDGFTEIAELLGGRSRDTTAQVMSLRAGLDALLDLDRIGPDGALRSSGTVLKSGRATPREFECVLVGLASSLGIEVGMAMSSEGKLIALVEIGGHWRIATPMDPADEHISQPLTPASLPPNVRPLVQPAAPGPVSPLMSWLADFAPGSGEPAQAKDQPGPREAPSGDDEDSAIRGTQRSGDRSAASRTAVTADLPIGQSRFERRVIPERDQSWIDEDLDCEDCGLPLDDEFLCGDCDERICGSCGHACPEGHSDLDEWFSCGSCGLEFQGDTPGCGCD